MCNRELSKGVTMGAMSGTSGGGSQHGSARQDLIVGGVCVCVCVCVCVYTFIHLGRNNNNNQATGGGGSAMSGNQPVGGGGSSGWCKEDVINLIF
jgi:hypothetical protein